MDPTFIGCIFTLALLKISFLVSSWMKNRRMEQTLFSRYDIPYVEPNLCSGSLHELRNNNSDENEIQVIDRWIKKYGKVFGYYVGSKPHLLVADVDMIKEILSRKSANYLNRPKLAIKANPVMDTLVGLRDSRWKEVRHMLSPAFTPAKLKPMMKNMNEKVDILISLIEKKCTTDGQLEWVSTYQGLTLDIISSCAFAMETNCIIEQDNDPLLAAVRDFLKKAMNAAVLWAQYFPIIARLMTVINNSWMKSGKATIMIVESLEKAISARRKDPSAKRKDILQMILDASEDSNGDLNKDKMNKVKPLTDKEIIANSWVFLLGGYETTASALAFTTYLLAKHPDVQEKLYEEISENMSPENDQPTYEDIMKLSYLDQVFNESLRMYPPVSSFLQRETTKADEINGLTIQKKPTCIPYGKLPS
ncbi:UNVERIFIED_CONTAM: hypothetical protein GTU68_029859 [Idotea baltica]|nr:hypothetical protein [Idotea baltica]